MYFPRFAVGSETDSIVRQNIIFTRRKRTLYIH